MQNASLCVRYTLGLWLRSGIGLGLVLILGLGLVLHSATMFCILQFTCTQLIYTVNHKKVHPFNFHNKFVKC